MTLALRYRRVSGVGQEDNSSLEKQQERIDDYCTVHAYDTTDDLLFTEVMTGVETFRERIELNKLFRKAETLAVTNDVVAVIDHPDRLARGLDLILIIEYLRSINVRVEFVQQKFEDDDVGKIVLHMQSWSSKQEWNRIKKRTHDGLLDRVIKDHKPLGSMPLYGYKWDDPAPKAKNRYVYNDEIIYTDKNGTKWSERSVVEYIFRKAKEGMTLYAIAQSLNDLGVPTRQRYGNNIWTTARMSEILSNPKYMGKYYAFQHIHARHGDTYHHVRKPVEDCVLLPDGVCPPIVDEDTWQLVQIQLDYNKRNSPRNAKHPELALCRNRVARCAYCGGAMGFKANEGRVRYYCLKAEAKRGCVTRNYITATIVDERVWSRCCEVIRDPQQLTKAIEAMKTPNPVAKEEKPLAQQRAETEAQIEEQVDLLATATTDTAKKRARGWIAHFEADLAEIEQKENILAGIKKNWQKAEEQIKIFEQWCIGQRENLDNATYSQKRTAVEFLGARATIWKYGTRPRITVDFAPPNIMQAIAGMEKKGSLTLYSLDCTNHAQRTG